MNFKLDVSYIETIKNYSKLLNKEPSDIIKEALEDYFVKIEKEFLKKDLESENSLTNLTYEEFFDGLDFDD